LVSGALLNIVNSSDAAMVAAGKGGVIPAVMGALRSHPQNGQLQVVCTHTLPMIWLQIRLSWTFRTGSADTAVGFRWGSRL
jgi:hypothetical protein